MLDSSGVVAEAMCGKHNDMCCYAGNKDFVDWIAKLAANMTEDQVVEIVTAACCAQACGITPRP